MDTGELVRRLAREGAPPPGGGGAWLVVAGALGLVLAATAAAHLGLRGDVRALRPDEATLLKLAGAAALMLAAGSAALRLARPGAGAAPQLAISLGLVGLAAAVALRSGALPPAAMAAHCVTRLVLLSLPGLAACLLALRRGAPARPALCGAAAGLMAAGSAAAGYALHCPANGVEVIAAWYGAAALTTAALGALLGPRILIW